MPALAPLKFSLSRSSSSGSGLDDSRHGSSSTDRGLEPPILVYHESARSIVFRDHLRRAARKAGAPPPQQERQPSPSPTNTTTNARFVASRGEDGNCTRTAVAAAEAIEGKRDFIAPLPHKALVVVKEKAVDQLETLGAIASEYLDPHDTVRPSQAGIPEDQIGGYQARIVPLPPLEFGPDDVFQPLLHADAKSSVLSPVEAAVVDLLHQQQCLVKTIKDTEWGAFLHRFCHPIPKNHRYADHHADIPPHGEHFPFNSFLTSTTLLPPGGRKMRCFGSTTQYSVGVIFALPDHYETSESDAVRGTQTWAWPSGYSAKTEFNIDGRGRLINGREEALVSLDTLREYNIDYLTKDEYMVAMRKIKALNQVPYNEVYVRVGGVGRIMPRPNGDDEQNCGKSRRSLDKGIGLPIGLFVRTAKFGHLISLLRVRARMIHILGESHISGIPLFLLDPDNGVTVLTESLQKQLWQVAGRNLNPFQNNTIAHKTTVTNTDEASFQHKVEELLELDTSIQELLTPEELARIAGGFGATDESVASVLKRAMAYDLLQQKEERIQSHKLQDIVNEGLASALRAGDYHTSRQLLILYSLVATQSNNEIRQDAENEDVVNHDGKCEVADEPLNPRQIELAKLSGPRTSSLGRDIEVMKKDIEVVRGAAKGDKEVRRRIPAPPPPPPLDTDRLRSATNSDGLLAVLGAAQVLRAMQDGTTKRRIQEVVDAVEEWINYGEQSVAFRISSWYDQRAAQGDLKINTASDSSFMAFVSNKAIANRKAFAQQLRDAISVTDFSDVRFLHTIGMILGRMHSPCLRLELLQYVLGLDNRYSVAHVARSVELAATCLDISMIA